MTPPSPFRRAMAAARKIPNAPDKDRAKRVHAWAEFVKAAIRDEDAAGKERAGKERAHEH